MVDETAVIIHAYRGLRITGVLDNDRCVATVDKRQLRITVISESYENGTAQNKPIPFAKQVEK